MICEKCPIYQEKYKPKNMLMMPQSPFADGIVTGGILFLGLNPSQIDDRYNTLFSGKVTDLITSFCTQYGINLNQIVFDNICRCATKDNKQPSTEMLKCCSHITDLIIQKYKPKIIVPLGSIPAKIILGVAGIVKHRGVLTKTKYGYAIASYHPSYCLRYPDKLKALEQDIRLIARHFCRDGDLSVKPIDNKQYFYYTPGSGHVSILKDYLDKHKTLAVDLETKTLNPFLNRAKILTISFSHKKGQAFVVPLFHHENAMSSNEMATVIDLLTFYFRRKDNIKIFHNGSFDILFLILKLRYWPLERSVVFADGKKKKSKEGINLSVSYGVKPLDFEYYKIDVNGITHDTALMHFKFVTENESHKLKVLACQFTNMGNYDANIEAYFKGVAKNKRDYEKVPLKELMAYNGMDTDATIQIFEYINQKFFDTFLNYGYEALLEIMHAMIYVRMNGITIDFDKADEYTKTLEVELAKIKELEKNPNVVKAMALHIEQRIKGGMPILKWSWSSTQSLATLYFDVLNYKVLSTTEKGNPSLSADVIEQYALQGCKISQSLMDYRKVKKKYGMYNSSKIKDKWIYDDGKAHPNYLVGTVVTERLSSANPNFQNFPRKGGEKFFIISSKPDLLFFEADYSQNEGRGAAHYSQDAALIKTIKDGKDIHTEGAKKMYDYSDAQWLSLEKEKVKELRDIYKAIFFGSLYGRLPKSIAADLWLAAGRPPGGVSKFYDLAEEKYNKFFDVHSGYKKWVKLVKRYVRKYQYVLCRFGHKRRLATILSSDKDIRAEAERQAVNTILQNWSGNITLQSLRRLQLIIEALVLDMLINNSVHDSINGCCKRADIPIIYHVMKNPPLPLSVPVDVSVGLGDSWGGVEDLPKEEVLALYFDWLDKKPDSYYVAEYILSSTFKFHGIQEDQMEIGNIEKYL